MTAIPFPFRSNQRGVTTVEFAILAPVMITLITGSIELGHLYMVQTSLDGAVSIASRDSAAQMTLSDDERDAAMRARITTIMSPYKPAPGQALEIDTKVYRTIGNSYPEGYQDLNGNGQYDGPVDGVDGEPFEDRNKNGVRDLAAAVTGKMGSEGDVISYNVSFPAPLYFPFLSSMFGGDYKILRTTTIWRNEPQRASRLQS